MKIRQWMFIILALFIVSCASLPVQEYDQAKNYRNKIEKSNLEKYAPESFRQAEAKFSEGEMFYKNEKKSKSKKALLLSLQMYNKVIAEALPSAADEKKSQTDSKKSEADNLKASVAVKEEYSEVLSLYNRAEALRMEKKFEEAIDIFMEAEKKFEEVSAKTKVKKTAAEESINSAKASLQQADEEQKKLDLLPQAENTPLPLEEKSKTEEE
ncbi:MAG TPA: hypothetical protein DC049_19525 [Spirochaetia bacterium]|nr:hypothetical protein [Spirochaetia bacterium]